MPNACFEMSNKADSWINSFGKNRPTVCKAKNVKLCTKKQLLEKNWRRFVFGEALSPVNFSKIDAKCLFWNVKQWWFLNKFVCEKKANCLPGVNKTGHVVCKFYLFHSFFANFPGLCEASGYGPTTPPGMGRGFPKGERPTKHWEWMRRLAG